MSVSERPVRRALALGADFGSGLLCGGGLGAFFDGILLHQILQWHNMLSNVRPPVDLLSMKYNMLYDGLFHAAAWLLTAVGVLTLLRQAQRRDAVRGASFGGGALAGWGLFNVIEGLVDHQIFGLHHVHPGPNELAWDWGFVLTGAGFVALGVWCARRDRSSRHASRIHQADGSA
jgi:uncharacterized membrane protein